MKNIIIIVIAIIVFGTVTARAAAPVLTQEQRNEAMTIPQIITKFAQQYDLSSYEMTAIVKCESSMNPSAIHLHDGGKNKHSKGLWQFQDSTWEMYSKQLSEKLDVYSAYDSTKVASYMLSKGLGNQWSCYRKIKSV